jgi:hypothetical protein
VIELKYFGGLSREEIAGNTGTDPGHREATTSCWARPGCGGRFPETAERTRHGRLNPEQWAEVERLFECAVDLPPEERTAFLERECPDRDLRQEVASLLEHSGEGLPSAGGLRRRPRLWRAKPIPTSG